MASDSDDLDISLFSEKFKKAKKKLKKGKGHIYTPSSSQAPSAYGTSCQSVPSQLPA